MMFSSTAEAATQLRSAVLLLSIFKLIEKTQKEELLYIIEEAYRRSNEDDA